MFGLVLVESLWRSSLAACFGYVNDAYHASRRAWGVLVWALPLLAVCRIVCLDTHLGGLVNPPVFPVVSLVRKPGYPISELSSEPPCADPSRGQESQPPGCPPPLGMSRFLPRLYPIRGFAAMRTFYLKPETLTASDGMPVASSEQVLDGCGVRSIRPGRATAGERGTRSGGVAESVGYPGEDAGRPEDSRAGCPATRMPHLFLRAAGGGM